MATPRGERAEPSRPLRLTRRGRLLAVGVVVLLASMLCSVGWASTVSSGSDAVVYETVTVQPGQSLWEIARAAAPEVDPRTTIARIVSLNGLSADASVRAGQQIVVPDPR